MNDFEYSLTTAHPYAQALMHEEFFWNPIEETAPFGSDDGSDAAYGFYDWRLTNKNQSPINYLKELIAGWNYPYFDWNEMNPEKINTYMSSIATQDEAAIQQQMQYFRDMLNSQSDEQMKNMNDADLRKLVLASSQDMGGTFLLGQDNAIIGTGFAQLALEGKVDADLKALTMTAINRQLLPVLIDRYDENYRIIRKEHLTKMLEAMTKANS